jgi:hypothetical protein
MFVVGRCFVVLFLYVGVRGFDFPLKWGVFIRFQYTAEKVRNNKLNYLDISIDNTHNMFTLNIYRKPATTDLIIHNDSCQPSEHKNSAGRYLINPVNTNPISEENRNHKRTPTHKNNTTKQ